MFGTALLGKSKLVACKEVVVGCKLFSRIFGNCCLLVFSQLGIYPRVVFCDDPPSWTRKTALQRLEAKPPFSTSSLFDAEIVNNVLLSFLETTIMLEVYLLVIADHLRYSEASDSCPCMRAVFAGRRSWQPTASRSRHQIGETQLTCCWLPPPRDAPTAASAE